MQSPENKIPPGGKQTPLVSIQQQQQQQQLVMFSKQYFTFLHKTFRRIWQKWVLKGSWGEMRHSAPNQFQLLSLSSLGTQWQLLNSQSALSLSGKQLITRICPMCYRRLESYSLSFCLYSCLFVCCDLCLVRKMPSDSVHSSYQFLVARDL